MQWLADPLTRSIWMFWHIWIYTYIIYIAVIDMYIYILYIIYILYNHIFDMYSLYSYTMFFMAVPEHWGAPTIHGLPFETSLDRDSLFPSNLLYPALYQRPDSKKTLTLRTILFLYYIIIIYIYLPICSMVLEYLPTFAPRNTQFCR